MGYDLDGKDPRSVRGVYFRASIWTWGPILDLCRANEWLPGDVIERLGYNFFDGLGANEAAELGDRIDAWLEERPEWRRFAREPGDTRVDSKGHLVTAGQAGWRDGTSPFEVDRERLRAFSGFLHECGGFDVG